MECVISLYKVINWDDRAINSDYDNFVRLIDNVTDYNFADYGFPEWVKKFYTPYKDELYDWEKYKEQTGIDVSSLECVALYGNSDMKPIADFIDNENNKVTIELDNVPLYYKDITILCYNQLAYQEIDFNNKFLENYEAEKKIESGIYVWTKKDLEQYKNEYCIPDEKDRFQKYIIDKFTEGEDCVCFCVY